MADAAFKTCPFCKEQIRQEAIKCRFCGEWLESSEPASARKLTADKPVLPPPSPPQEGNEPNSMKAVARALDEMNHQQRSANPQDKTTPKASATTGTVIHLKRPRRITLDAIEILGVAALVFLLYVQDKQIKRLKLEVETAKAKAEPFQTSDAGKLRQQFAPTIAASPDTKWPDTKWGISVSPHSTEEWGKQSQPTATPTRESAKTTPNTDTVEPKAAEQRTYETVGKGIRKADLVTLSYHQALKDFGDGIEDFHAEISYGDLSGDGNEDAAVTVHCRFGPAASANPSDVFIYALKKGRPELVARAGNGEKAHGGICLAYICCEDCFLDCGGQSKGLRRLLVERYRPSKEDCNACYGSVEETQHELRESGLVAVDSKTTPMEKLDPTDPCAVRTH